MAVDDARRERSHLAQVNVALLREPLDAPATADFVAALEPINQLADHSPGFLWRLQTPEGDATSIRAFDDDRILVNLSLWESLETLWAFTYASRHLDMLRRRREWFHRLADAHLALWWVPAGHVPTVAEAGARLELLRHRGPSPDAFTLREPFPAPDAPPVLTAPDHDRHWQFTASRGDPAPRHVVSPRVIVRADVEDRLRHEIVADFGPTENTRAHRLFGARRSLESALGARA